MNKMQVLEDVFERKPYLAPLIEVTEYVVENGFADSIENNEQFSLFMTNGEADQAGDWVVEN